MFVFFNVNFLLYWEKIFDWLIDSRMMIGSLWSYFFIWKYNFNKCTFKVTWTNKLNLAWRCNILYESYYYFLSESHVVYHLIIMAWYEQIGAFHGLIIAWCISLLNAHCLLKYTINIVCQHLNILLLNFHCLFNVCGCLCLYDMVIRERRKKFNTIHGKTNIFWWAL